MTVEQVLQLLESQIAPIKVSDDLCAKYRMYDNSGIIINCGKQIEGALFSLDLSEEAVRMAIEGGHNLIVTHHPAIYGGISRFDLTRDAHARALAACIKHDISVISMHLNFDAAPEGIDYHLMKGLGGVDDAAKEPLQDIEYLETVDGGNYGRVYEIRAIGGEALLKSVSEIFSTENILVHGKINGKVRKVASFCGAGCNDRAVDFAKRNGADVFVCSDMSHHHIAELVESGIAVIQLTHYAAEAYGFNKIYDKISGKLQVPSKYFFDVRFA